MHNHQTTGEAIFATVCTIAVLVLFVVYLIGGTDKKATTRILQHQGYTSIKTTEKRFWGCSKGDYYRTGFKAIAPTKTVVSGLVCCGLFFKSCTVRFD